MDFMFEWSFSRFQSRWWTCRTHLIPIMTLQSTHQSSSSPSAALAPCCCCCLMKWKHWRTTSVQITSPNGWGGWTPGRTNLKSPLKQHKERFGIVCYQREVVLITMGIFIIILLMIKNEWVAWSFQVNFPYLHSSQLKVGSSDVIL